MWEGGGSRTFVVVVLRSVRPECFCYFPFMGKVILLIINRVIIVEFIYLANTSEVSSFTIYINNENTTEKWDY